MAASSRFFRRLAACLLVVLCAGTAAWICSRESSETLWAIVSSASSDESTVEQGQARVSEKQSALEVSAPISTSERPAELSPQEKLNARVDAALGTVQPMDGGPSVSAGLSAVEAPPREKKQDPVVTSAFVSDFARWLASSYVPAPHEGRGATSVTLRSANARYCLSNTLRSTESDTLKARASILRYVCSPGVLEVLYRLYALDFLDELDKAARLPRKNGALSDRQTADMFRLYASLLRRTATALDAASRSELMKLAEPVRRAAASEEAANSDFAKAYNAHALAREAGQEAVAAEQSSRMEQSARRAALSDERKISARRTLARALRTASRGPTLSDDELAFLGEWLARRGCDKKTASAASSICSRMAGELSARAEALSLQKAALPQTTAPAPLPVPTLAAEPLAAPVAVERPAVIPAQ